MLSIKSIFISLVIFALCMSTFAQDSIVVRPTYRYDKGKIYRFFFGFHYRELWETPIKVEIFNLEKTAGGLKPLKTGGSLETTSLHLLNKDGKEYLLRLIIKDPSKALPPLVKRSYWGKIIRDQNSAANPYAALILPYLSEAVGIIHAYPKLVYIPADTSLGKYAKQFANSLALLEEKADDESAKDYRLGDVYKVSNSKTMLKNIYKDNKYKVDQEMFLRCRLFDMLISDWGRHEDQWKWAAYTEDDKIIYKSIPRDRDHAFYKFSDGLIPWIFVNTVQNKYQTFNDSYHSYKGLNKSARFLDDRFLNELSFNEWERIVIKMQSDLTDSVIENAVKRWPTEVYNEVGPSTIRILKNRRDELLKAAYKSYQILVKEVSIAGSDKDELFVIKRLSKYKTSVVVLNNESIVAMNLNQTVSYLDTLYYRIFDDKDSRRLHFYGLGGNDVFMIEGNVKRGIIITLSGGEGKDVFYDRSYVKSLRKKTWIVDDPNETEVTGGSGTKFISYYKKPNLFYFNRKGMSKKKKKKELIKQMNDG